ESCFLLGATGPEQAWVAESDRVLAKTGMIGLKQEETIYFTAPEKTGSYVYLCTFPGHAMLMRGTLRVAVKKPAFQSLAYRFYEGKFSKLPDVSKLTPTSSGNVKDKLIDVRSIMGNKVGAIVWEGSFEVTKTGPWEFFLGSDDGSRLAIDGEAVIENDGIHAMHVVKGKEKLQKGTHSLRLAYFDGGGNKALSLVSALKGEKDMVFTRDAAAKKAKAKPKPDPIVLRPEGGEAIVHRTFLPNTEPRSIAVGYPGGINLSWNADTMNLDLFWRGGFVDVGGHWNGRGSGSVIAGFDQVAPAAGMALQVLDTPDEPWVSFSKTTIAYERDKRAEDFEKEITIGIPHPEYEFLGYQLGENRFPTFRYRFHGLEVADTFSPATSNGIEAIKRTLTFSGTAPPKTFLRLGVSESFPEMGEDWFEGSDHHLLQVQGADPFVREGEPRELLVPISTGEVHVTYRWKTAVSGRPK
ncbi:MAG: PA14 domain-containing protein, partial [Verrucomicrobiota bacterium]